MKKIIASVLLAAAAAASQATPLTLTAHGSHVQLGSSDYNQPFDWTLVLTWDSSQTQGKIDIQNLNFAPLFVSAPSSADASPGMFTGSVNLVDDDGDGDVEGDFEWTFGTTSENAPTRTSDLDGTSNIYAFYLGQYRAYITDSVTITGLAAPVPEPGTVPLTLSGVACLGLLSAAARRRRADLG